LRNEYGGAWKEHEDELIDDCDEYAGISVGHDSRAAIDQSTAERSGISKRWQGATVQPMFVLDYP